jgi:glycine cleavage system H protein
MATTEIPSDLKYTRTHEWLRPAGEVVTVGLTDHAQQELTDVVFVELPAVGRALKAGESCAVVESVKTASEVYAPVTGQVIEVNPAVMDNPGLVNREPYGGGWFFKLKLTQPDELGGLLSADAYRQQIGLSV